MNAYNAKDMARSFRTVRKNTIQIAEEIPEDQYGFKPSPQSRSVAETLAHIAVAPQWGADMHRAGITNVKFEDFTEVWPKYEAAEKALKTKSQILKALKEGGESYATWLDSLTDVTLAEHVHFPAPSDPPSKSRFEMILSTKEHEMHHRAQLMVAERMIGLVPHLTRQMEAAMAEMMKPKTKTAV